MDKTAIRHAATVIVLRDRQTDPKVLMGQRGAKAAFMPNKFVFPGGAVDAGDYDIPLMSPPRSICFDRLQFETDPALIPALYAAAIRELWEETGLRAGISNSWSNAPLDWQSYAATGLRPTAAPLSFVFRAITPPGRPRRFDARFFLMDAVDLAGDPDDFSQASDELSHLQWVPLRQAGGFDLPFITEVVLSEISKYARTGAQPETVPFFRNDDEEALFLQLSGKGPLLQENQKNNT
ncbi:MAG: NUDIX hydrolase [Pseudoruegeria sp.]